MNELKPCPFCGEGVKVWYDGGWYVECLSSLCRARTRRFIELENAIEAWNTRAERTCTLDRWKHERTGYPTLFLYRCSSCGRNYTSEDAPDIGEYCAECGAKVVE